MDKKSVCGDADCPASEGAIQAVRDGVSDHDLPGTQRVKETECVGLCAARLMPATDHDAISRLNRDVHFAVLEVARRRALMAQTGET